MLKQTNDIYCQGKRPLQQGQKLFLINLQRLYLIVQYYKYNFVVVAQHASILHDHGIISPYANNILVVHMDTRDN